MKLKTLMLTTAVLVGLSVGATVSADHGVDTTGIADIFITRNGDTVIEIEGASHESTPTCTGTTARTNKLVLLTSHEAYTQILATLIAAQVNDSTLSYWVRDGDNCAGDDWFDGDKAPLLDAIHLQ